jgi:hypothetical protein
MIKLTPQIKKFSLILALSLLVLGFFFATAAYNYVVQSPDWIKFSAPDEASNYTFSKLYAETGRLTIPETNGLYAADIIHPRSVRSDAGVLKPVSFPGIIILYGTLAKFLGAGVLPYLTPLFAALGLLAFYFLLRMIFDRRTAIIGTILLAFFPVYIYYSARSFFHNVLFLDLFLAGLCFLVCGGRLSATKKWLSDSLIFLGGLVLGFALTTRASEALWVAPLLLLLYLFNCRRFGLMKILFFLAGFGFGVLPLLYWNQVLYGSIWATGYSEMNNSLAAVTQAINASAGGRLSLAAPIEKMREMVFYFGFHPDDSFKMAYYYFVAMFPWLFAGSAFGVVAWLANFKKITRAQWLFFGGWILAGTFLVLYYGSWKFVDNPDPARHTIGNSYTRYWLPLYAGALAFFAFGLKRLSDFCARHWGRAGQVLSWAVPFLLIGVIAIWSISFVLVGSEEGLIYTAGNQQAAKLETQTVLSATPVNSVIITQYHDKYLFPERKVIVGLLTDDTMNYYYGQLAKHLPVYYFNFTFRKKDLDYLNNTRLPRFGLRLRALEPVDVYFTLYQLEAIKSQK